MTHGIQEIEQAAPGMVGDEGAESLMNIRGQWIPMTVQYETETEEAMFEQNDI